MTNGDRSKQPDFQQWKTSVASTVRSANGLTSSIRNEVWTRFAENFINRRDLDWRKICEEAFEKNISAEDEFSLNQIVKDLHRTGTQWSMNELDRTSLQRVLLGFARFQRSIGYCQGLHILASLIFDVVQKNEEQTLMILIYLIDFCLPDYFSNNLKALAIDVTVFNQWLELFNFPLTEHLKRLRENASENEPPLVNVFTIQWFLTVFATCLSAEATLRVWDALFVDGNEILFRTALILWSKLSNCIVKVSTADEFYSLMTNLSSQLSDETLFTADELIKEIYEFGSFPTAVLTELREKWSNIISNSNSDEKATKSKDPKDDDPRRNFVSCFAVLSARERIFNPKTMLEQFDRIAAFRNEDQQVLKQRNQQIQLQPWKITAFPTSSIRSNSDEALVNHLLVGSKGVKRNQIKQKQTESSNEKPDPAIDRWIRKSSHQTPKYSSFNPFPSRSFNGNVVVNGCKLGLYSPVLTTR